MNTTRRQPPATGRRRGVTLIELLMVIGILSILAGLTLAAVGAALNSGREKQTQTIIAMIDGVLQERQSFFRDEVLDGTGGQFRYFDVNRQRDAFDSKFSAANGGSLSSAAEALFVRKKLFATVFPQRFRDLCGFDGRAGVIDTDDDGNGDDDFVGASTTVDLLEIGLGGDDPPVADVIRVAVEAVNAGGVLNMSNHNPNTESSELLYLCITNQIVPGIAVLDPDQIPQSFLQDTDQDGLLEFVDGFGQPLRFYTFTSGLFRPTPWTWTTTSIKTDVTAAQAELAYTIAGRATSFQPTLVNGSDRTNGLNRDLDDRYETVRKANNAGPMSAEDQLLAAPFSYDTVTSGELAPGLPISLGTVSPPMIVSAGPDGVLGLGEPADDDAERFATPEPASGVDAIDNLTSLQRSVL